MAMAMAMAMPTEEVEMDVDVDLDVVVGMNVKVTEKGSCERMLRDMLRDMNMIIKVLRYVSRQVTGDGISSIWCMV